MGDNRVTTTSMVGTDALVAPHGDIDISNSAEFESAMIHAAMRCKRYVFVDLADVTFIDAAAIGAIVRAGTVLNSQSRRLQLVGAWGLVQRVLDLTRIGEIYGIEAHVLDHPQATEC
jgi:anti-sigma B factor antagonist